jgi:pyruvate dehydrogenase E1 component alpha subunit
MLAYGIDPKVIMAELTGRQAGISKGKGGSMHMFSVEHKFYGGHGIVGAQVSLGTGLAFKHKYSGDGGVCMAYFGDGAPTRARSTRASTWRSCGDCGSSTRSRTTIMRWAPASIRASAEDQLYRRGESFRIPGIPRVVAWMCSRARPAAQTALRLGRAGQGPVLLELENLSLPRSLDCRTPPNTGARRRSRRCATSRTRSKLPSASWRRSGRLVERSSRRSPKAIRQIVTEAAGFAEQMPEPDPSELYTDVLVETY